MIFDGHAYCFPSLKGNGGFDHSKQLNRHLQHCMANHHQPTWQAANRSVADESGLINPSTWWDLESLKNAEFHPTSHGRFEWTVGGVRYVKQYLPPSIIDMAYGADQLIAEMDYAGVDKALLHRIPYLGIGNDFIASCVTRYPDRLLGLAHVEEWLITSDPHKSLSKVAKAVQQQGLSGLHFLPNQLDLYGQYGPWESGCFQPFWDGFAELDVPVFFTLRERRDPVLDSFKQEFESLGRWLERYPDVKVILTHGLNWRLYKKQDRISLPDYVWAPFENPNVYLQFLFPIALGGDWDYPMPQVWPTIEECVDRIGVDRLMWGTDMPIVTRFWTYLQNIELFREHCTFLTSAEKDAILGDTAARLLGV